MSAALNRRALLGGTGAVAVAAIPTAARALSAPADPWDTFIAGLGVLDPKLPDKARAARAAGWHIEECYCVIAGTGFEPALLFRRQIGANPEAIATFQHRAH